MLAQGHGTVKKPGAGTPEGVARALAQSGIRRQVAEPRHAVSRLAMTDGA